MRAAITNAGVGRMVLKACHCHLLSSPVSISTGQRGAGNTSSSPGTSQHPEQPALAEENGVEEEKVFQVFQELSQRMELGMQLGEVQ